MHWQVPWESDVSGYFDTEEELNAFFADVTRLKEPEDSAESKTTETPEEK